MEKRPAVSAERLTTSSPKRGEEVVPSDEVEGKGPFETSVPDQQVVIKDEKAPKRATLRKLFGDLKESFNILIDRGIVMVYGVCFSISREEFPVWE